MNSNEQKDTPLVALIKQSQLMDIDPETIASYESVDDKEEAKDAASDNPFNDEQAIEGHKKHLKKAALEWEKRYQNVLKTWNQAQT